jgi:putative hydrolase of the HAD superfamily
MPSHRSTVLFDWGDTLIVIPGMLNAPEAHLACARRVFAEPAAARLRARGQAIDADELVATYRRAAKQQIAQSNATSREHCFEDRFALTLSMLDGTGVFSDAELNEFAGALAATVIEQAVVVEGAVDAVTRLAKRFRLGLVSNYPMAAVVEGTLARFGMADAFERVAISGASGWLKPHPNAFRAALDGLVADPGSAVFVGDDMKNDVKGGKRMGMRTVWYAPGRTTPDEPDLDFHAHSLAQIADWCERSLD